MNASRAHLYRSHRISHSCDRCCQSFTSADDLHAHMVAREPCRFRTRDHCEGFTQATKERLEPVGRHQGGTGETDQASQWWEIYGILFPDVPREDYPSPCEFLPPVSLTKSTCFFFQFSSPSTMLLVILLGKIQHLVNMPTC